MGNLQAVQEVGNFADQSDLATLSPEGSTLSLNIFFQLVTVRSGQVSACSRQLLVTLDKRQPLESFRK